MKNKIIFLSILIIISLFSIKNTYAFDQSNYANRVLCGNYELAEFNSDGTIITKSCHSSFDEAKRIMKESGNANLALLGSYMGYSKIIDANAALVDFTKPSNLIYLYSTSEINEAHTYINGQSGYGAVDGAYIDSGYSVSANAIVHKVKIGGFEGWVIPSDIEIVPLSWVKSSSSYTVSSDSIRHNYVSKIQNPNSGNSGNTIGPKPTMLEIGTYYSYDGHYFYKDLPTMIKDYKNGNCNNSINIGKPYYNYYQFLPNHSKTTYSSINIDEYIRNNLGYGRDVYGTSASSVGGISTSRLYGKGTYFYNAQEIYGVNAVLALSLSRNETRNGTSNLAINKNNGFGLNAVDSNPTQASDWYATFSSSIYGYANKWVTYGYSNPNDWRYFGNHYGNKDDGMNVKYASDVYWGEKMASHYYFLDKALGMQDYDYYQIGVTNRNASAMSAATYSSKNVYNYRSANNAVLILGEVQGQEVNGNKTWYKVMSDLNIDSNFNRISSGPYNWNSYVYVPAAHIVKVNEGKKGYQSPNEVTEYQDSKYTYDLYIENTILKPKVGETTKETEYYYDSTLTTKTGQKVNKTRYLMVYATAYNEHKKPVAYLVTSDYKFDQKHWISADSIKFITCVYGQAHVTVEGQNLYTTINPTTIDDLSTHISGLYHYTYTPIMEVKEVNGETWYKVPVNLSGTTNSYGWTLATAENVYIQPYVYKPENEPPIITAADKIIIQGKDYIELDGVTATDAEDGEITGKIKVIFNNVNIDTPGTYKITYQVIDNNNNSTEKTIVVTVIEDEKPIINAKDKKIEIGKEFDEMSNITAKDKEDGDITKNIKVIKNTVKPDELGIYEVTYQVTDSYNHTVEKTIKVTVTEIILVEKKGRFDLDYLKKIDNKLNIKGYSTIDGIDNNLDISIEYTLIFENINKSEEKYEIELKRIKDDKKITYSTPSIDGKDYKYSWFEGNIDITKIPVGDYVMYVQSETDEYYSKNIVNNQMFSEQLVNMEQNDKYLMTRNNYFTKEKQIEILIRNEKLGDKTVSALSNQYGQLEEIKFTDENKLYIYGNAYSLTANLGSKADVQRKIIFENMDTYKRKIYDLGSVTKGLYTVKMPVDDKLAKERAWYQKEIDISDLPKGKYSIYIQTISNVSDIGELNEQLFRDLSIVTTTINNKKYTFGVNYNQRYRVELNVE